MGAGGEGKETGGPERQGSSMKGTDLQVQQCLLGAHRVLRKDVQGLDGVGGLCAGQLVLKWQL